MEKNISIDQFLLDLYIGKIDLLTVDNYINVAKEQQRINTQKNYFEKASMWLELKKVCETIKHQKLEYNGLYRQNTFNSR